MISAEIIVLQRSQIHHDIKTKKCAPASGTSFVHFAKSQIAHIGLALHNEILAFIQHVSLNQSEIKMRDLFFEDLKTQIRAAFPQKKKIRVEKFGSFTTGCSLWSGDIDVAVWLEEEEEEDSSTTMNCTRRSVTSCENKNLTLAQLTEALLAPFNNNRGGEQIQPKNLSRGPSFAAEKALKSGCSVETTAAEKQAPLIPQLKKRYHTSTCCPQETTEEKQPTEKPPSRAHVDDTTSRPDQSTISNPSSVSNSTTEDDAEEEPGDSEFVEEEEMSQLEMSEPDVDDNDIEVKRDLMSPMTSSSDQQQLSLNSNCEEADDVNCSSLRLVRDPVPQQQISDSRSDAEFDTAMSSRLSDDEICSSSTKGGLKGVVGPTLDIADSGSSSVLAAPPGLLRVPRNVQEVGSDDDQGRSGTGGGAPRGAEEDQQNNKKKEQNREMILMIVALREAVLLKIEQEEDFDQVVVAKKSPSTLRSTSSISPWSPARESQY